MIKVHRKKGKSNFTKAMNKNLFQESIKTKIKTECENNSDMKKKPSSLPPLKPKDSLSLTDALKNEEEAKNIENDILLCLNTIKEDPKIDTSEDVVAPSKMSLNVYRALEKSQSDNSSFCSDLFLNDHMKKETTLNSKLKCKSNLKKSSKRSKKPNYQTAQSLTSNSILSLNMKKKALNNYRFIHIKFLWHLWRP